MLRQNIKTQSNMNNEAIKYLWNQLSHIAIKTRTNPSKKYWLFIL